MAKPIKVGQYNTLSILREVPFGLYLDDGAEGILLPKRFVPPGAAVGQKLKVFVYHDGEGRLIATTQKPFGKVGDFVKLKVVQTTPQGAFLDNGLMKDLFVPRSRQIDNMRPGAAYLVHIYIDEQTGRITATEKFDHLLSNQVLSVKEGDLVTLIAYRPTDLGWEMIVDGRHKGLLYHNEIFMAMEAGKQLEGYVKKIYADGNKLDVALGRPGYTRIEDEAGKIMRLLQEAGGFLPYHDKTAAEDIYAYFGMSKKAFKMAVGKLYKEKLVAISTDGIHHKKSLLSD